MSARERRRRKENNAQCEYTSLGSDNVSELFVLFVQSEIKVL